MGGFLTELGKKLAERWLALLVLPGALYVAVAVAAVTLGHTHPFAVNRLVAQVTAWVAAPSLGGAGGQVVLLLAILAAAAVVGTLAQALGSGVERLVLAADWQAWPPGARHLARWQVNRRRTRWDAAAHAYQERREEAARLRGQGEQTEPAPRYAAWRRMTRIAPERPARPTSFGDRIHAVTVRIDRDLHLDLALVWPYLWLILPETTRIEITTTRQSLTRATVLSAWAVLYVILAVWWWPAAPIAFCLAVVGMVRLRAATDAYALLLEAATRLHLGDLAQKFGLEPRGAITVGVAENIVRLLRSSSPPHEIA